MSLVVIILSAFFETATATKVVPDLLTPREETYTLFQIVFLSLSFLLIAVSRNINARSLFVVIDVFFRDSHGEEVQLKEHMKMNSLSSILLLINFFISFSLCNFIFFHRILLFDDTLSLRFAFLIPLGIFLIETLGILIAMILSGEPKKLNPSLLNTLTTSQFAGIFFTGIALFWLINPGADKLFLSLFLAIVAMKEIARLLKSSSSVLTNGISWYYLILYLCTLEILPLFMIAIYVLKSFIK